MCCNTGKNNSLTQMKGLNEIKTEFGVDLKHRQCVILIMLQNVSNMEWLCSHLPVITIIKSTRVCTENIGGKIQPQSKVTHRIFVKRCTTWNKQTGKKMEYLPVSQVGFISIVPLNENLCLPNSLRAQLSTVIWTKRYYLVSD